MPKMLLVTIFLGALAGVVNVACGEEPPPVPREFRAAWIATVANIDWPSKPGLPAAEQREELVRLLDLAARLRMNAVVLQVRPACDAMYDSPIEPWSEFLTGEMGKAPDDGYDPLEFAVAEAHRRGIELHAWFNPYRAAHPSGKSEPSAGHVSRTHPEFVREYGKYLWLDPGEPAAAEYSTCVVMDVVRRYDIDAVHFDDYFYPYPINDDDGNEVPFPDEASWNAYRKRTAPTDQLARDDWRRENVNQFLRALAKEIKQAKPWVRFGVSPFGIYRPGQPESIQGFDAYAKLYADSRLWLDEGIVDYLSPQLYWPIEQKPQSFPVLLDWWRNQNRHGRHVWPGLYTSKVLADGQGWPTSEIANQIELTRQSVGTQSTGAPGHIHFSIKAIAANRSGLADLLSEKVYPSPALLPATPWCELPKNQRASSFEPVVTAIAKKDGVGLSLSVTGDQSPWLWVAQWKADGKWSMQVLPGVRKSWLLPKPIDNIADIVVRPVDRLGLLGDVVRPLDEKK